VIIPATSVPTSVPRTQIVTIPFNTGVIIPARFIPSTIGSSSIVTLPTLPYTQKYTTPFVTPRNIPTGPISNYIVVSTLPPSPIVIPATEVPTSIPTWDIVTIPHQSTGVIIPTYWAPTNLPTSQIATPVIISPVPWYPTVPPTVVPSRCAEYVPAGFLQE